MRQFWKYAFFAILAVNILFLTVLGVKIFSPIKDDPIPEASPARDAVEFQVQSNKEDLNRVIQSYIKKETKNSPVKLNVYLKDQVIMYGEIPVFSSGIDYKLTFEPKALENGDIVLKQKEMKMGRVSLPVSYVMKAAKDAYPFPDWVKFMPNDQMIYLSLNDLKLKSDVKVRADQFNLKKDDIQFTFMLPIEDSSKEATPK
ncbi:YpmS family protein [Bacillus sp. REN10]|uniref:YpmS family protein n=1 Tax=Bacillus sp. REN10 TaxID=2782541 RepID=UPI00193C1154|nr:YpmS family protein [Bacillus sp. REN10]